MNRKLVMGLSALVVLGVIAVAILRPWVPPSGERHGHEAAEIYTCPMHPSVVSDRPGACPVCGMALVKQVSAAEIYTCPMHPSVVSDRPGACPVCGMALVKKTSAGENGSAVPTDIGNVRLSPSQRVLANVSTAVVGRRDMGAGVSAVGVVSIAEPRQATVAARFRGRVERLYVAATGTAVRTGDPLLALYSPEVISAQREYLIAKSAAGESATVNAALMRLSVHYGMTADQIRTIEETGEVTSTLVYHAPIGGIVIRKDVQEGQYVDEGMVLYQLADLSRVWGVFEVYESDIRNIAAGQQVRVTAGAYPGESFSGRVTLIEPLLQGESRTVRVRTELVNADARLKPNMFLEGVFLRASAPVLAVPSTAVLMTGKRSLVWIETETNVFEPREVLTGARAGGFTEIRRGLQGGEHVAVTGGFLLDSESTLAAPSAQEHRHD